MNSIRIFDKDINLIAEIDDYTTLDITNKFYKFGEFELKINTNKLHTEKLIKNNLIVVGKNYNKVGIILHREFQYSQGKENTDLLIIKGYLLDGLISRRLIVPNADASHMSFSGSQEFIIKSFVESNCVNAKDNKRNFKNLAIAENKNRGSEDSWRGSYDPLNEKVSEICEYAGLGFNITLDTKTKKFIFDVIESKDLTTKQSILPPVIFRSDFNNIDTRQYIESIINSKNVVYAGTKEDSSKMVLSVGDTSDFERIETFTDVNSDEVSEITKQGRVSLKELEELKTFELDVKPYNTFIYEKDYNIGDIVTIQDRKLKVTMDTKIVESKEQYTPRTFSLKLTFGKSIPTVLEKIKRAVKN